MFYLLFVLFFFTKGNTNKLLAEKAKSGNLSCLKVLIYTVIIQVGN